MSTSTAIRPSVRHLLKAFRTSQTSPSFLLPSLLSTTQSTSFSSSTPSCYPRDMNRERGVSTVRRTGPRYPNSMSKVPLPKPVLDPAQRSKPQVDEDHGLWEFFHARDKPMNTPEEDAEFGRPWKPEELRSKSWEDLHSLWWVCCKERNRIATESMERNRIEAGYGNFEAGERDKAVRLTQRVIKQVLTERFYAWENAQVVAKDDPEVNISGDGPAYIPSDFAEDVMEEEYEAVEGVEGDGALRTEEQSEKLNLPDVTPEGKPESRPSA